MTNHTDAIYINHLVERLRGDCPEILVEKDWMLDSDAVDKQRAEAADCIEALEAEVGRELGPCNCDAPGDADLVAKLRDEDSYYRVQEKHWCIDAKELERQRLAAANRIEALKAKVEGLRDLLVRGYVVCDGDDEDAVEFRNDARAALGEKQ